MSVPILFVHASDELYGSDIILLELVRNLDKRRFSPHVVLPQDLPYEGQLSRALETAQVPHTSIDMAVLRRRYASPHGVLMFTMRLIGGTLRLRREMQEAKFALVHSHTGTVWCGAIASKMLDVPHVFYIMEIVTSSWFTRRLVARFLAWRGDKVVAISHAVKEHLLRDAPSLAPHIEVIPPGINPDRFRPNEGGARVRQEWGVNEDEVLFGVVGRIHWWKGQEVFLQAATHVARQVPQARFAIVGDVVPGEEWRKDELKRLVHSLGIADKVIWPGYRKDTPHVMAALDVLVLPSTEPEPFGRVIVEAMATEKPVIASAHGGPVEIVLPHETGLLVPPRDPEALAKAMIDLARRPEQRLQMGRAGRRRVLERYTIERHVAAFEDLYERMLARGDRE